MTAENTNLQAALEKVAQIDFSRAEAEALADALAPEDEVSGFAKLGPGQNETFRVEIDGLKLGDPTGGNAKLGPGQNETFRLRFGF